MSDSDSDESVGARAARDRFQPGTQEDYNGALNQMEDYVKERYQPDSAIYARCMTHHHKLKMPVDFAVSKLFIRDHVQDRLIPWPEDNREPSRRTHMKHLTLSTMCTVICAMKFSYTRLRKAIPPEISLDYNNIFVEYKNFVGSERMCGNMPPVEGAAAITYDALYMLMESALKTSPEGKGSAESSIVNLWLFLIMAWSTLCRGERVGRVQLSFIRWIGDALGIGVPTSKSDAAGMMSYFKLCYSNCLDFTSCVVTALGVRVASGLIDAQFLFGSSVGDAHGVISRMRSSLKKLVAALPPSADLVLQVKRDLLTMHMPKKSGIRHLNGCGITGIHTPIHLRADHKCGPYDTQSDADGVVGRLLADLQPLNLPPPHWHPAVAAAVPWCDFIPGFAEFPEQFRLAIPNIIASVIWHHDALSKSLPITDPLHGSPLFTTHRVWIGRLFPLLIGGTTGKSLLCPSGRSVIMEVADDMHELLKRESRLCTVSQVPVEFSDKQLAQISQIVLAAIPQLQSQPQICAPSTSAVWANVMPLMYLGPTFRFPVSIGLEDAYRRWFSPRPPLPPLHLITSKMIPACNSKQERKVQKALRSKFAAVMLVLHGLTTPQMCKRNIAHTWKVFWSRAVNLFSIEEPCTWTVSTAVGKFYLDKAKLQVAITCPALLECDVPLFQEDLPETWTDALQHASTVAASGKRLQGNVGRPRSSAIRLRLQGQAVAAPKSFDVPSIAPCSSSVLPHVSAVDDWTPEMYATAGLQARYKCPACNKDYASTSGIHAHWEAAHPDQPVPSITQARTRVRVPLNTAGAAELQQANADAAARAESGRQWLIDQALTAAADTAASAESARQWQIDQALAAAAAQANQLYVRRATRDEYQCPFYMCEALFATTSGIRKHWQALHSTTAMPCITEAGTRRRPEDLGPLPPTPPPKQ
jgi:hypothetical protein